MIQIFGRARRAALGLEAYTDRSADCCPYGGPANRLYDGACGSTSPVATSKSMLAACKTLEA